MPKAEVLVVGTDQRNSVPVVRSLGRAGVTVAGVHWGLPSLAGGSRFVCHDERVDSPARDPRAFAQGCVSIARHLGAEILIPLGDSGIISLGRNRDLLPDGVTLALTNQESVDVVLDKRKTFDLARQLGIPIPDLAQPDSVDDAVVIGSRLGYPVVAKPPSMSFVGFGTGHGNLSFKVAFAANDREVREIFAPFEEIGRFPLMQRFFRGKKVCQEVVAKAGAIEGIYQYRSEREYPHTGGVTWLQVSEPIDPVIEAWSRAMMSELNWNGPANIQYLRSSDEVCLLEINGRFGGPLAGAYELGLDFPLAAYSIFRELPGPDLQSSYRLGVRRGFLPGAMFDMFGLLLGNVPAALVSRGRALREFPHALYDFLRWFSLEAWDFDDRGPAVREIKMAAKWALNQIKQAV